ncbi:RNA 2',3'-cyclic phosphodiesterase [candidate division TA06 bacterium]|nr:RNA 2',3'-cyclic phosphodiesterase [candidate division TA06 bacterium]
MRTFIAIELPAKIRRKVKEVQDQMQSVGWEIPNSKVRNPPSIKWVREENIHLTLKFLGELIEEQVQKVIRGVEETVETSVPFSISLESIGAFPSWKRANVIWVGVERGKEEVTRLQRGIEESLMKLQFKKEENPFSPHITIGRVKRGARIFDPTNLEFSTEPFLMKEISVMKSTLTPSGPIYDRLRAIPLGIQGIIVER